MQTHTHPVSGVPIEGEKLSAGSSLEKGDLYDSTDGSWRENDAMIGAKIESDCTSIWVRPHR